VARQIKGQFLWHELMTSDPAKAKAFYPGVTGWKPEAWDQDGSYTIWMSPQGPVGGCMKLPPEGAKMGLPPHWLSYVGTPDVDATCADVKELGGSVMKAPWDIPTVGRVAVLADPQGAIFCVYKPAGDAPGHDGPPHPGDFSWHELATTDPEAAFTFYGKLFGWKELEAHDMGPAGTYWIYGFDAPMGGVFKKPDMIPMSNWLPYVTVPSADDAAEKIKATGGAVMQGPMEVPGGDRIAMATDPSGAAFAVHSIGPKTG
jgi:predicted enzyme related to lactoylglutathione lyase